MLDASALQQLSQLKKDIRANKDIAQGTVRGTQSRYGFVHLDDGRDAFLAPDKMDRVFPGDRVQVNVIDVSDGAGTKFEAEFEKLLESPLSYFVGQYVVRGQGHFVAPDVPGFSRWIFVPPKARKNAKAGDWVACRITQHPYRKEGKAQAQILDVFGAEQDAGIEARYMLAKFELQANANPALDAAVNALSASLPEKLNEPGRQDLTDLDFVTIDADTTRDMDDALHIESTSEGYLLRVAIAQPGALLGPQDPLTRHAQSLANTLYFPGTQQLMLPGPLSHDVFSLVQDQVRPVLVVSLQCDKDGKVTGSDFSLARMRSRAKLSYQQVAALLDGKPHTIAEGLASMVNVLGEWSRKANAQRSRDALIMEDRADYDFVLNEQQKIQQVVQLERTSAHQVVEEAMLATNVAAGQLFAEHKLPALYSSHAGPREDRLDTIAQMLAPYPELAALNVTELEGYVSLIRNLSAAGQEHLLSNLRRQLQPGKLSLSPAPHLGLGFRHYATITSPIRRFNDLYNQMVIAHWLGLGEAPSLDESELETLQDVIGRGRQAVRQAESWMLCQFLGSQIGSEFDGKISMVNSAGFGVRLSDNSAEGFVLVRTKTCKPDFDPIALTLTLPEQGVTYHLDKPVRVKLEAIESDSRRLTLSLVESGEA
ncbi:VacB/RNase II family 3'-5' exoribonuclease [Simiduia agarivorans]|uniref:exoribonuclease II n=1 Tax=Simiduia agarivorans (strain DSM 21679 / JCM 13881 / BCRC 17597 / SA1) TaxID=1117647 RepID=K4KGS4_SIMAS|nr:VacB/RNase II family 3'-5' exoribonuclease [Simiduia agarivorans]AFU98186.2 exoribonuclease II [Simiduia agarivorans SA1 = DSM 21679]